MYDIILFDLDGTLTESAEGITNSVIFALGKMGIEETDKDKLKAFVGSNLDGSKINKDEVITSLLERNGIMDKAKVLMVGDREHDVIGAKKVGVACVGVLYGYGNYEELENAGADYIVEKIENILNIV